MCGIIGGVTTGEVSPVLLDGLRKLEYRGYDSAGMAVIDDGGRLRRLRAVGKVRALAELLEETPLRGGTGIAHTRWATHGGPRTENAHPHVSGAIAVVHNGIVENHDELRAQLRGLGYEFTSETDTEVIAHLTAYHFGETGNLRQAVVRTRQRLEGAFTFAVICADQPGRLVAARQGSPLVLGTGEDGTFVASDTYALASVARRVVYLEDGDVLEITSAGFILESAGGVPVERPLIEVQTAGTAVDKAGYRHFMLKEIHEQPAVVARSVEEWVDGAALRMDGFGTAREVLPAVRAVHIVACGTSYHAGLVGRHWFESLGIPCHVEVASEYRYRRQVVSPGTLLVTISQSGETADTLAALRQGKEMGFLASLSICNVQTSSLVRESDHTVITRAGPEIGVASTKAFTSQLVALMVLALGVGKHHGTAAVEPEWLAALSRLPGQLQALLHADLALDAAAEDLAGRRHALFLGRGIQFPVALEGALKLKEISYIHAEAYPAGELKHGPLALVDHDMAVICTLPFDQLRAKTLSNLKEVQARGGKLLVFADDRALPGLDAGMRAVALGEIPAPVAPILFTVPLQLLAYKTAVQKGADVDQPRNLAKSVTVE
jgi:glucosamine--fructose-6-phosphate aminotransferase (isomerizing)